MVASIQDTTWMMLEEVRVYLEKQGCKNPKLAAIHVTGLVWDDLILQFPEWIQEIRSERAEKEASILKDFEESKR